MKIAYCSLLLPEEKKIAERTKERLSGISNHKVTAAEIEGIDKNLGSAVDIFNIINAVNYPKFPQILFRSEKWNHSNEKNHVDYHIGYVNIFGIKYITQYFKMYRYLKKWIRCLDNQRGIICVHNIYLPNMLAAVMLKRKFKDKIRICLNTGDVPGNYGLKSQNNRNLKELLIEQLVDKNVMKLARNFDCYVFVTAAMANAFGVENKPYAIVECAYIPTTYHDINMNNVAYEKTIFYAGSVREEYGILHLLRAFSMIKAPDYRLVICGGGPAENKVKEYAIKDSRISYLGFVTPQEVLKNQMQATVLVSPRQSVYDYVKYSFPSKSVDSLASGIPYVAHRLPCDPPEYEAYIMYADETDEGLRDKLVEICEMSALERKIIGERAKKFILEEKNPIVMTKVITDMWASVVEE